MNNIVYESLKTAQDPNNSNFHISDIAGDIIEDGNKVELNPDDIAIVELENILGGIHIDNSNIYEIMKLYENEITDSNKNIIYVINAINEEQLLFFSFIGFCTINERCGLENRIPMIYIGTEAGRKYLQLANYIIKKFASIMYFKEDSLH